MLLVWHIQGIGGATRVPQFEPVPFRIVDTSEQLKAFTDPLRSRVLSFLAEREATNQQVARALSEPHAKVLHHVRTLLEMGLIRLVDTRIKGGNVEKYYRAEARMFGIRPPAELRGTVASAEFEALRQEVAASAVLFADQRLLWEGRKARLSPEQVEQFYGRLLDLIAEYWGGPPEALPPDDPTQPMFGFAAVVYRDPADPAAAEPPIAGPQ
jgi:DNA-binding transcriptional ArsR family regulator